MHRYYASFCSIQNVQLRINCVILYSTSIWASVVNKLHANADCIRIYKHALYYYDSTIISGI